MLLGIGVKGDPKVTDPESSPCTTRDPDDDDVTELDFLGDDSFLTSLCTLLPLLVVTVCLLFAFRISGLDSFWMLLFSGWVSGVECAAGEQLLGELLLLTAQLVALLVVVVEQVVVLLLVLLQVVTVLLLLLLLSLTDFDSSGTVPDDKM